jgi:hypothetical protein
VTVVANIMLKGIPVLIGDTLLVTTEPGASSMEVPTNKSVTSKLTRPVSGFARKVYILGKRCCVAWAGSRTEAQQLIPQLKAHLHRQGVKETCLIDFLSSQPKGHVSRPLRIIGWIADPDPRPFWWSNQDPKTVWLDEYDVEGTGEETFNSVFFGAQRSVSGGGLTPVELTSVAALAGISRLLTAEVLSGLPLTNGFGFCYDIAIWKGYRFAYVPSYTQLNYDVLYNEADRTGQMLPRSQILIYNSIGQSAAFSVVEIGDKVNEADGSRSLSGEPVLIPPLWDKPDVPPKKLAFASRFLCVHFRIQDKQGHIIQAPLCITNVTTEGDGIWLGKNGSIEFLNFKVDLVSRIYDEAIASLSEDKIKSDTDERRNTNGQN